MFREENRLQWDHTREFRWIGKYNVQRIEETELQFNNEQYKVTIHGANISVQAMLENCLVIHVQQLSLLQVEAMLHATD